MLKSRIGRALGMGSALAMTLAIAACADANGSMTHDTMADSSASSSTMGHAAMAGGPVMVGGSPMYPSRNIVENAVNSKDHTTLVAAVKAAGLVETLESSGPFTVFAPTNEAFAALPPGTVNSLMEPANKQKLAEVLTYHVVPGKLDKRALTQLVEANGGKAKLKTVEGEDLTVTWNGPENLVVIDGKGDMAQITTYDVEQSNGVIQVIDRVLLP